MFHVPCWRCRGEAAPCRTCARPGDLELRATGRVWFKRCPGSLFEPWLTDFLRTVQGYRDGFLPAPGGLHDQARVWLEALRVAMPHQDHCASVIQEREAKRRRV